MTIMAIGLPPTPLMPWQPAPLPSLLRYSDDQPREPNGQFGSGGGDGGGEGGGDSSGGSTASFNERVSAAASGTSNIEEVTPFSRATEDDLMNEENIGGVDSFAVSNAIADYGDNGHASVNAALRASGGDEENLPESMPGVLGYSQGRVVSQVEGMDAAMSQSKLTSDVVVHRGVGDPEKVFGTSGDLTGMQFQDHGYVSTTTSGRASGEFTGNRTGVEMRILVPAGTGAISSFGLDKTELVLERGLTYTVVSDRDVGGLRTLDVEVSP